MSGAFKVAGRGRGANPLFAPSPSSRLHPEKSSVIGLQDVVARSLFNYVPLTLSYIEFYSYDCFYSFFENFMFYAFIHDVRLSLASR